MTISFGRNPNDSGQTIIPDLAHSWEIAKDGKTYTFFLRKGVEFSDGGALTSADVKATFDRITKPPSGINIPRSALFKSVDSVVAPDEYTVQFKLSQPRPADFIMGAIASGWNGIVRKKTLEDNDYNLRKVLDVPGTGPFQSVRRVEQEVWEMKKNPNYWNEGLPYLDGIEFYHALPFSPELGSALLSGPPRLCPPDRPGHARGGRQDGRTDRRRLLPERYPGDLDECQERSVGGSESAPSLPPGARSPCPGRCRQGCRSDDGWWLRLSVLPTSRHRSMS